MRVALLALSALSAHAATSLQVQTTTNGAGTALQTGWDVVEGPRNNASISGVVDGVTITVDAAFGRSFGADGGTYLDVDHTDGNLDALLSGGRLINDGSSITLTLSGLGDGDYDIKTYHHSPFAGESDGLFEFDVLLTDANGTGVVVHDNISNSQGASVTTAGLSAPLTSFTASGGNDVVLVFDAVAGFQNDDDQLYLNGFELTQIPEPSAALLAGLGVLALLRRRRQ